MERAFYLIFPFLFQFMCLTWVNYLHRWKMFLKPNKYSYCRNLNYSNDSQKTGKLCTRRCHQCMREWEEEAEGQGKELASTHPCIAQFIWVLAKDNCNSNFIYKVSLNKETKCFEMTAHAAAYDRAGCPSEKPIHLYWDMTEPNEFSGPGSPEPL